MAKNSKWDGCQKDFDLIVYKSFDKTFSGVNTIDDAVKSEIILNQRPLYLAKKKIRKAAFRIFKEQKVYSSFTDNIWGADLAYMQ